MAHWNEDSKKRIKDWIGNDYKCIFVGFSFSGVSTDDILDSETDRIDLIIGYNESRDLYAAWNPYLHYFRKIYRVSIRKSDMSIKFNGVISLYANLNDGKSSYEKKLLIKPEFMETFCKNWKSFLKPDDREGGYNKKVLWADKYQPEPITWEEYCNAKKEIVDRDKSIVERVKRDCSFRDRILGKYKNPCCCICRCNIQSLLEAAHIQAVADGGDDSTENGILLCRNHHKMYDDGMIKISGDSLIINDERVKKMAWYQEFVSTYKGKVLIYKN